MVKEWGRGGLCVWGGGQGGGVGGRKGGEGGGADTRVMIANTTALSLLEMVNGGGGVLSQGLKQMLQSQVS